MFYRAMRRYCVMQMNMWARASRVYRAQEGHDLAAMACQCVAEDWSLRANKWLEYLD